MYGREESGIPTYFQSGVTGNGYWLCFKELLLCSLQADSYTQEELAAMFTRFSVTAPVTGNPLSQPMDFNLMFKTSIGPGGTTAGLV